MRETPKRWPDGRPEKAGGTVRFTPPGLRTAVQARVVAAKTDGPGRVAQIQYDTPEPNNGNS